jgi:hypothetical protein
MTELGRTGPRDTAAFRTVRAETLPGVMAIAEHEATEVRVRGPRTGTVYVLRGVTVRNGMAELTLWSPATESIRVWRRPRRCGIQVMRDGF